MMALGVEDKVDRPGSRPASRRPAGTMMTRGAPLLALADGDWAP